MKIKTFKPILIFALWISLSANKCRPEIINIKIDNKSNSKIIFTCIKDTITLRNLINSKGLEYLLQNNRLNFVDENSQKKIEFAHYDFEFYTPIEDNKSYKFYYAEFAFDKNKIILKNEIDSLCCPISKIKIGENEVNNFMYLDKKMEFK